jgi:predicted nucleotidyltransferase
MTQTDQDLKKIAEESAPAIKQLVSDTNEVIKTMQATWSLEEKIQFCKWFLGVETVEQMAETMGMTLMDEDDYDPQLPLDLGGNDEQVDEDESDTDNPD